MALLSKGRRHDVPAREQQTPRRLLRFPRVSASSPLTTITILAAAATLVPMASAHDHHEDDIPEGMTVSPEPLVRFGKTSSLGNLLSRGYI